MLYHLISLMFFLVISCQIVKLSIYLSIYIYIYTSVGYIPGGFHRFLSWSQQQNCKKGGLPAGPRTGSGGSCACRPRPGSQRPPRWCWTWTRWVSWEFGGKNGDFMGVLSGKNGDFIGFQWETWWVNRIYVFNWVLMGEMVIEWPRISFFLMDNEDKMGAARQVVCHYSSRTF